MAYDEVIHLKKVGGWGWGWGGWITPSSTDTLTNKTIDDYTNFIHADGIHLRVKATEPLVKWDVIKFVWFNDGEQAIEVAKRDNINVPAIWVIYTESLATWEFGMAVSNGLFKWIDTSAFSVGTILYPNASGGFTATNPWWYAQQMAYVVRSHAINWEIMINVWPVYDTDLTNYYTKTEIDIQFSNIDDVIQNNNDNLQAQLDDKADSVSVSAVLDLKADKTTTYTKTEIDNKQNLYIQNTVPNVTVPSLWIDTTWWNYSFNLVTP